MKFVVAVILFAHGVAHLVGAAGAFELGKDIPHRTTLLSGQLEVGEVGIRGVGIGWAGLAALFATAAIGLVMGAAWFQPLLFSATALSIVLCLFNLPDARIGLVLNVFILAILLLARLEAIRRFVA